VIPALLRCWKDVPLSNGVRPIAFFPKRGEIINQFAAYYNGMSSTKLAEQGLKETRILISTDVLPEGLNLQDATRLINYDLH
jgi:hypothetical protein